MEKIKKIMLGDYPGRRMIAVLLLLSVIILCFVFQNEMPEAKETDVVTGSTGQTKSVDEYEDNSLKEDNEAETFLVDEDVEEPLTAEESLMEESESGNEPEPSTAPDKHSQDTITQIATFESETSQTPEPLPTPEATTTPERTPITETIPKPEPMPAPEIAPTPEPEEKEQEPEETPIPHEHSWNFDSWYQEPTCSNGGLVIEICAHCGETQITGGIPTGEHSYEVETPGDCLCEEVVVCTVCNDREVREKNLSNHIDVEDGFCYGCGKNTD